MRVELTQVRGDTWVLEARALIPLYRMGGGRCILLDTGLPDEREGLVSALERCGLTPVGVLASHAHRDHLGSFFYLRERYGARLALPRDEAALCRNPLLLRGVYDTGTPSELLRELGYMLGTADETPDPRETEVTFCSVPFTLVQTPGHSPGHVCVETPDGVLYLADALMSPDLLQRARLPYHQDHGLALESIARLQGRTCHAAIVAHRSVETDLEGLIDRNLALLEEKYAAVAHLLDCPITQEGLLRSVLDRYQLYTSRPEKATRYARNTRAILEYLVDDGRVSQRVERGVRLYERTVPPGA